MFDVDEAVAAAERKVAFLKAAGAAYSDLNTGSLGGAVLYFSRLARGDVTHVEIIVDGDNPLALAYVEIAEGRVYAEPTMLSPVCARAVLRALAEKQPDAYCDLVNIVQALC